LAGSVIKINVSANLQSSLYILDVSLTCIVVNTWKLKVQLDETDWFLYCKTYCSLNMFRAPLCPSSGAQDLYRCLLPVVLGALVYRLLVCGLLISTY